MPSPRALGQRIAGSGTPRTADPARLLLRNRVVAAYALELDGARRAEAGLPALEAAQDASFPVGSALAELVRVAFARRGHGVKPVAGGRDQTPACGLDLAEMLRQAVGDPGVSRLDAGAVALEVVRAGAFPVGLVELFQIRLRSGRRCGKRECHNEHQVSHRHDSSFGHQKGIAQPMQMLYRGWNLVCRGRSTVQGLAGGVMALL